ncbi:hypothetical protein H6G41_03665 [Tolypothrix sp. FACHB-123]|uniref:hypothetical protein n=1 Tax=Tolypothrix sp. FACHB-123 TaxID=2692868 RepID=UPI0016849ED2|nr:hypothetical protein [Tolypothrix sp. FACHB-123]MBD2353730.1 hypothetical protein [Tolypothrix sp. FACHB-123]
MQYSLRQGTKRFFVYQALQDLVNNPTQKGMEFLGMGHSEEITNAQCPKRRGGCPSPPTRR